LYSKEEETFIISDKLKYIKGIDDSGNAYCKLENISAEELKVKIIINL
jgi:hypothetical protein